MKAKKRGRLATYKDCADTRAALVLLLTARDLLRGAGSNNAADKVRRAIKSTQGAVNHAERMYKRAQSQAVLNG